MPRRQKQLATARIPAPTTNGHAPNGKLVASATTAQGLIEVTNRDRMLFQLWGEMRPDQLAGILRQALIGNLVWQERLFQKMQDEWPRLQKNILSLKQDVSDLDWSVQAFAEKGGKATDSAQEKAELVERALLGMQADPEGDCSDFGGMIKDIVDAVPCCFSISEIYWTERDGEIVPLNTKKIPARFYGYGLTPDKPDRLMLNPLGNLSFTWENLEPFPANKFLVGVFKGYDNHPSVAAKLRSLTPWWFAQKYGLKWFMLFCQVFGSPFRMAKYTPGDQDTFNSLCSMLEQMGNTGWGAFPAGSEVEFMESKTSNGTMLPQRVLAGDADEQCDIAILGQTLTSTSGRAGGNRALGEVHADTERKVLNGVANFVKQVINHQLIKPIILLNYGETSELPTVGGTTEEATDELAMVQRDEILFGTLKLPVAKDFLYERHSVPEPAADAELFAPVGTAPDPAFEMPEPPVVPPIPPASVPPPSGNAPTPGVPATAKASDAGTLQPSMQMAAAVKRGLDLRKKTGRGGSLSAVARARDISARRPMSVSTVKRMQIYFDSHPQDAKADPESAAGIAWALHGGNAGKAWVESVVKGTA